MIVDEPQLMLFRDPATHRESLRVQTPAREVRADLILLPELEKRIELASKRVAEAPTYFDALPASRLLRSLIEQRRLYLHDSRQHREAEVA